MTQTITDDKNLLWSQYESEVDLYKFYINFVLKVNSFQYTLSAVIFSYVITHISTPHITLILLLPLTISIALVIMAIFGYGQVSFMGNSLKVKTALLGLPAKPTVFVLKSLIILSGIIQILLAACTLYLLFCFPESASSAATSHN